MSGTAESFIAKYAKLQWLKRWDLQPLFSWLIHLKCCSSKFHFRRAQQTCHCSDCCITREGTCKNSEGKGNLTPCCPPLPPFLLIPLQCHHCFLSPFQLPSPPLPSPIPYFFLKKNVFIYEVDRWLHNASHDLTRSVRTSLEVLGLGI